MDYRPKILLPTSVFRFERQSRTAHDPFDWEERSIELIPSNEQVRSLGSDIATCGSQDVVSDVAEGRKCL
jgi:hypothetical protein